MFYRRKIISRDLNLRYCAEVQEKLSDTSEPDIEYGRPRRWSVTLQQFAKYIFLVRFQVSWNFRRNPLSCVSIM